MSSAKSCLTCPSYLKPHETIGRFRKSIDAPMCGRYGTILGRPDDDPVKQAKSERSLAAHYGSGCVSHGEPQPREPQTYNFAVALPDVTSRTALPEDHPNKKHVTTCANCINFIGDSVVAEEMGWTTGLCRAKGRLIFPNRRIIEATGCEFRQYGTNSETTQGLELFPEYSDAFGESANAINQWRRNQRDFVDPKDYPSDRDVTDAERTEGLRAWRRVVDQENPEHEVFLPIFDAGFFSEAERSKIPQTGDYEHPEDYVDHNNGVYTWAVCWMQLDETPVAWGMAGVGKTEIGRHMAWLMQIPFERFSITGSTELDDLAGKTHFEPSKGTYFQYGRLPLSWQKPCVIVLDEPNTGQPDVWQFLRPLTDNSKQLVLDTNNGERISKHPDCYLMMAMNPAWDVRNSGVEQLSDADGSRLVHMEFDLPPAELEREIIKKRIAHDGWELDKARLDDIMKIAEEIRPLTANGTIPVTWGIRPQIKVARAMRWFDPVTAYRRAVADLLEPEAREMVLNIVRQNVGEAF